MNRHDSHGNHRPDITVMVDWALKINYLSMVTMAQSAAHITDTGGTQKYTHHVEQCAWDILRPDLGVNCHRVLSTERRGLLSHNTLRSASGSLSLQISRTRLSTFGSRAFSIFGPSTWNVLPLPLRNKPLSGLL